MSSYTLNAETRSLDCAVLARTAAIPDPHSNSTISLHEVPITNFYYNAQGSNVISAVLGFVHVQASSLTGSSLQILRESNRNRRSKVFLTALEGCRKNPNHESQYFLFPSRMLCLQAEAPKPASSCRQSPWINSSPA